MPTIPITMPTIAMTTAMTTVCEYSYDYGETKAVYTVFERC